VRFCTIASGATLPHARVLADGLAIHHPGERLLVLLLGEGVEPGPGEPFDVLRAGDIEVPLPAPLLGSYRWADLTLYSQPHLLSRLVAEGAEASVYLDVAGDVVAPLDTALEALDSNSGVLVPRALEPLPADSLRPSSSDLSEAGRMATALVGLSRRHQVIPILDWWSARLAESAAALAPSAGAAELPYPSRQLNRWLDLAPTTFSDIAVLQDPGLGASWWNLHERTLSEEAGSLRAAGAPLRLLSFEGFRPDRPSWLADGGNRVRIPDAPLLVRLTASYAERLGARGWADFRRTSDVGRRLPNGLVFDDRLSALHGEAVSQGVALGDVFRAEGADAFMEWLKGPAPHGADAGINRYLHRLYLEREDLPPAYPDLDGPDGAGYAGWTNVFAVPEMDVPVEFLPPPPPGVERRLHEGPPPALSVNVTGYFTGTLGLGEAARGYVRAFQAADIPVVTTTVDVHSLVEGSGQDDYARHEHTELLDEREAAFNLVCVNADELPHFAAELGDAFFAAKPSIGVWAWETDHIPKRWEQSYRYLDEIWVYSTYVAENIGRAAPVPVVPIPPPVSAPDPQGEELDLGVPEGFRFLFMFDFFSTIQRKNPVGLIRAFCQAFEPGEGPQLVIKTINGRYRPRDLDEVRWAMGDRPDVHVIDQSLSPRARDALLTQCDCYVSLHRSEGFGLTLAECMALGKPVIGTGFSAVTDFLTQRNGYLVEHELTRVGAECEVYPSEGVWAEPSVEHAAELMRRVYTDRDEARQKGERARLDIERDYSPDAVGKLVRARLERIATWRAAEAPPPPPAPNGGRPVGRHVRAGLCP